MSAKNRKISGKLKNAGKRSRFYWRLGALAVNVGFIPLWVEACPRCFAASPYRIGFLWAVAFLLPVPFALAAWIFWWIRKASRAEFPNF